MFWQSSAVIPAHTPGTDGASRAPHLRVSLVAHSASDFAGAAHSVNDELAALVLLYPDQLLAELAVTAVFQGANPVELYGEAGAIIGEGLSGTRPEGRITHNGQPVPFQPVNPFLGEVTDFVEAVQQHRPPCAT